MKQCQGWQLLALAALMVAGCRGPQGQAPLERELRYQEDMIYELQDYLQTYRSQLRNCQAENRRLQEQSESGRPGSSRGFPPEVEGTDRPDDGLAPPDVELPGVEIPGVDDSASLRHDEPAQIGALSNPRDWPADRQIVRLALQNARGTVSGGVQVVVQPRNVAGQIVPAAGHFSVAALDLAATTEEHARLARWHFSPEQTALLVKETKVGSGAEIDLLWPDDTPKNTELQLFARIITDDGRRIQSEIPLSLLTQEQVVRQPADASPSFTPRRSAPPADWGPRTSPLPEALQVEPDRIDRRRQHLETPRTLIEREAAERQKTDADRPPRAAARPKWSPYR